MKRDRSEYTPAQEHFHEKELDVGGAYDCFLTLVALVLEGHVLLQAQLGGGCVERSVECRIRVQSEAWSESEMASLSFSELNVESEAAILTGRVKRVSLVIHDAAISPYCTSSMQ
ncbi:hypothetical protein HO173_001834 [Letharia columbiana]|uniref:Uncharacterized protein n=1 Tax=Letharia columbiana TaxID=112416 RepID=A0A8H6L978_9LECA|nr:uncharacterized protein HO173_001834 [Letharia columbiana]KAF6240223.1 hypothetical protein HO173_001834 [Letharia columbiana]